MGTGSGAVSGWGRGSVQWGRSFGLGNGGVLETDRWSRQLRNIMTVLNAVESHT